MGEEQDKKTIVDDLEVTPEFDVDQQALEEELEEVEAEIAENEKSLEKEKKDKHKKKKKQSQEEKLLEIEDELKELKDKYYRSLAEAENVKKRLNEEVKRERKYGGYAMANRLIDSIEVFNQALNMETNDPNLKNFLRGFKMIDEMIFDGLKSEGVSIIETNVGDTFDPNKQHAMDISYDPEQPENTILKVVKKGYMFKDRILRPSMVIINIKPEEGVEQASDTENQIN